jgi:DNA-binding Lrp family transcriptional regulator
MRDLETLTSLFDNKIIAILAVLVNDSTGGLYLREISKYTKVSDATTYRIIKKLLAANIIQQHKIKKLKLYFFNHNENTDFIYKILKKDVQVLQVFVEEAKKIENIQSILLHGAESSQRANILIIGTNIDTGKIKELSGMIKEKYNFVVSPLILTSEQFEQMSVMGLYSGKEKVLFKK